MVRCALYALQGSRRVGAVMHNISSDTALFDCAAALRAGQTVLQCMLNRPHNLMPITCPYSGRKRRRASLLPPPSTKKLRTRIANMDSDPELSDSQRVPLPLSAGSAGAGDMRLPVPGDVPGDADSECAAAADGGQPDGMIDAVAELGGVATEGRLEGQADESEEEVEVEYRSLHGERCRPSVFGVLRAS